MKFVTSPYQIRQNIVSRPFLLKSSKEVLGNHAYVFNAVKASYHAYVFNIVKSSYHACVFNNVKSSYHAHVSVNTVKSSAESSYQLT